MMLIGVEMSTEEKKSQNNLKVALIFAKKVNGNFTFCLSIDIYILNKEFYFGFYLSFT